METKKRNGELTKRERALMAIKIIKHVNRYKVDPVILKLEWKGEDKSRAEMYLNEYALESFFNVTKMLELSSIYYSHYKPKTFKELTGKVSKEAWESGYFTVAII
jgi:hypothetical protein